MTMMLQGTDQSSPSDLLCEASFMATALMGAIEASTAEKEEREGLMLFLLEIRARIDAAGAGSSG